MKKITSFELENLIKNKIKEKGLLGDIDENKVEEIKRRIKDAVNQQSIKKPLDEIEEEEQEVDISPKPTDEPGKIPDTITTSVTTDEDEIELAKKEGELKQKEEELEQKEQELLRKEENLEHKEEEVGYKPQLPYFLEEIGSENLFIFDENEISVGGEKLSNTKFRLMSDPDNKKSIHDLWVEEGKKKADVFKVKFEKIGEINFNPFEGTSKFEEKRFEITPQEQNKEEIPVDEPLQNQEPAEEMIDSIEPVKDKTLPQSNDMGLKATDIEQLVKDRIDTILRDYLINKPKV